MTQNTRSIWTRLFVLTSLLPLIGIAVITAISVQYVLRPETVSARLTSSGRVLWGEQIVPLHEMDSHLRAALKAFNEHDLPVRLLIETYSDTKPDDIAKLIAVGEQVGFKSVVTESHDWISPQEEK